jgi:GT2 family glycosyltransferase
MKNGLTSQGESTKPSVERGFCGLFEPLMDLSVCIPSFNTRELLKRTIQAVLDDGQGLDLEVIVIDNASSDGSGDMVRETFPRVRLVSNLENRFFTAACNRAFDMSQGEYLLALNSDALIQPGTLYAMVSFLRDRPDVDVMTTRMLFPDGRVQHNCARFPTFGLLLLDHTFLSVLPRRRELRAHAWYADWDRLSEREVDVIPGSLILMRREVFRAVGGFDETFRLYFAEDDWCFRVRQAGFKTLYAPLGGVIHPESSSVKQIERLARRIYFEDLAAYTEKYFGRQKAQWLKILAWPTRLALDLAQRWREL